MHCFNKVTGNIYYSPLLPPPCSSLGDNYLINTLECATQVLCQNIVKILCKIAWLVTTASSLYLSISLSIVKPSWQLSITISPFKSFSHLSSLIMTLNARRNTQVYLFPCSSTFERIKFELSLCWSLNRKSFNILDNS